MSFSFGAPSSAPANTGLSGFSFGANKPATAPSFGLAAPTASSTGLFGSTATSAAPLSFGATTTPAFGATTTPAFGATTTPAFGATTTPAFGATTTPAFGAPNTGFGATATSGFGATATPGFGATTSTAPAFGATATSGTGLTGGLNFGAGSNAPATGLSFGAAAPTASTGLGGFGFGSTAGTATTQSTGFGLFGANTSITGAAAPGFFGAGAKLGTTAIGTQPTATAPSLGLGGVSTTSSVFGGNTTTTKDGKGEPPKQTKLPNEISTTVENFKEFVKKQKSLSSDISRVSIKPIQKVSREVEELSNSVCAALSQARGCRASAGRLRTAAAAALRAADTMPNYPPGTVLESSAPPTFIKELMSDLEQQLLAFRRQMDVADKQMQAAPKLLTEQELTLGIRRMHESLVALAGRLQAVHTQVEGQKEQYLNLRKYILKDPTNVFEEVSPSSSFENMLSGEVQSKKSKMSTFGDISASAVLSDPKSALSNMQQLAGPSPFSSFGLSSYPGADFSATPSWQPTQPPAPVNTSFNSSFANFSSPAASSSFQLQKPPGKRGKQ